jgi:hypothetical protein
LSPPQDQEHDQDHEQELKIDPVHPFIFSEPTLFEEKSMKTRNRSFLTFIALCALICPIIAHAKTPKQPAPDLVIEKTTQTSSTFWVVKVRNNGNGDSAPTTLKMVATPGGSYSCPVAAIKAGGTTDVPCRMPFKAKADMRCEFTVNPDKSITEASYANNRTVSSTNPKFN